MLGLTFGVIKVYEIVYYPIIIIECNYLFDLYILIQLNIYMYCLNLKYGILLYECKDDQEISEFLVEYDVNVLAPVFKKIKYVKDCIQKGIIPPREDNHNCVWCKHKKTCK